MLEVGVAEVSGGVGRELCLLKSGVAALVSFFIILLCLLPALLGMWRRCVGRGRGGGGRFFYLYRAWSLLALGCSWTHYDDCDLREGEDGLRLVLYEGGGVC